MPTVIGIEAFRDAMEEAADEYVLIGGGACSILFDREGEAFRATRDLDIVVFTDSGGGNSFAHSLWEFIRRGGYECWKRSDGSCSYYRFILPQESPHVLRLPGQIELFARHPEFALEDEDSEITPLPFEEDVSSLSAIILDDGYYEFIRSHVEMVKGVPTLAAPYIIPLKMRAHVDLNEKHKLGRHVNEKDLSKHRSDVSNLSQLLSPKTRVNLTGQMRADAEKFLDDFEQYVHRQTRSKQRQKLEKDLIILRMCYLGD